MAIDRSKMRKALKERQEQSARTAESGSSNYVPYIKVKELPIPFIKKIPEGDIVFDIIPFQVSENFLINPETRRPEYRASDDDWYYVLDLWVHGNVGPGNHSVICPKKHLGTSCPICDIADKNKKNVEYGDKEAWKSLVQPFLPKRRVVYQVWVHVLGKSKKEEEEKGVQILEMSHFHMEKELVAIARDPETGESIDFAWPGVEGKKVSFSRKGTGMENTQFFGHKFINRKEDLPDEILDQAIPLNEYITIMDADEIQELLDAAPPESSDDDEEAPRKPSKPLGRPKDEDEEEAPRKARKPLGRPKDEDEEEDKPRRRRPSRDEEDNPCPKGHRFGVDTDDHKDCEDCPDRKYNACAAKKQDDE